MNAYYIKSRVIKIIVLGNFGFNKINVSLAFAKFLTKLLVCLSVFRFINQKLNYRQVRFIMRLNP